MISIRGTHLRDITKEPFQHGNGPADTTPQVSPDGTRVVFNRCFSNAPCAIAVADLHTGRIHDLTNPALDSQQPNWSPDGNRIVFEYHPPGGMINIAVINRWVTAFISSPATTVLRTSTRHTPQTVKWIVFSHYPARQVRWIYTPCGRMGCTVTPSRILPGHTSWSRNGWHAKSPFDSD